MDNRKKPANGFWKARRKKKFFSKFNKTDIHSWSCHEIQLFRKGHHARKTTWLDNISYRHTD